MQFEKKNSYIICILQNFSDIIGVRFLLINAGRDGEGVGCYLRI